MDEDAAAGAAAQNSNGSFEVESLQKPLKDKFKLTMEETFNHGSDFGIEQIRLMQDMIMCGGGGGGGCGGSSNLIHQAWSFDQSQVPSYWDNSLFVVPGFDSVHQPQIADFRYDPSLPFPTTGAFDPTIQYADLAPAQQPFLRELLPGHASLFGSYVGGEGDGGFVYNQLEGGVEHELHGNRALELTMEMSADSVGKQRGQNLHVGSEKERRTHMKDLFEDLRNLIPNPTKIDRASIIGDAIDYIKQLIGTVDNLKLMVEKKRCGMERTKRQKVGEDRNKDLHSCSMKRKSKETEVDVRIVEGDVTIKLVQRKKNNCLLNVSRVLDDLQLDLHHVAGGHIGEHCSFLLNSKIYEGSFVFASAVANKLMEVLDGPAPSASGL